MQDSVVIGLDAQVQLGRERSSFSCSWGLRSVWRGELHRQRQLLREALARKSFTSAKQDLKRVQLHRALYAKQRDDRDVRA